MDQILPGWMSLLWLTAAVQGLQVSVPEKKKVAMLFQPALLRCRFSTSSRQPAVVQWKFKSYCQDRTGEALGMANARAQALSKRNLEWDPLVDCVDSRRTVRVVASKQGSAVTVGDFYKGREVTIVHDADLQIGKLMWGDSGLYYCIIITPDDVEGKNEDAVELLVLGRTGLLADLLPSFAVDTMSEWVFVGLVILGVFLFFLLVGICWCQCCPHSCCCYVRCPCCPDSCCCPRALYEAGKAAKAGYPPAISSTPGPYYIPSVPVGSVSSSAMLMDKPHAPPLAPSDSVGGSQNAVRKGYRIQADKERDSMKVLYYVEKELAQFDPARRMRERYNTTISELSSLHEDDGNFRQSYRQTRRKPPCGPGELEGDPEYWTGVVGGPGRAPSGSDYSRDERESFRQSQQRSKSEMLSRKNFALGVPAVSMDELAAFADSYSQRSRRGGGGGQDPRGGGRFERSESRGPSGPGPCQDGSLEGYYSQRSRSREPLTDPARGWAYSPPRKRADEDQRLPRLVSRTPGAGQMYEPPYLGGVLERKARPEGGSLETASRLSSRPGRRGTGYYGWSPPGTYKAGGRKPSPPRRGEEEEEEEEEEREAEEEEEDALPPYSERELSRGPSYRARDPPSFRSNSEKRRKKENEFPTRMSLVV
ncbi:immunoglobulin-like domain-containing receptor 2 isoform X3 [Ornithorhynchus anatinus]|uniref:immunoglobulin-like domain-containing receptor 2 isoform X3 n=1 Tax=Ornithorhynchus anatinus TaxID=9258 RepID=UPI0010A7DF7E|nr:immunoglobulin-like domain-containing receptor 2 isoform X3 [Ornithorhynchus anatinus]